MRERGTSRVRPLVALVLVSSMLGLGTIAPPATGATAGSLAATPGQGIAGEPLTLKGKTGTKVVRPVRLQVKQGGRWSVVARATSTKRGKFTFATVFPATSASYRVKAPRTTVRGTTHPAVTTPVRAVTVQTQAATLALPSTGGLDDTVMATGTFSPARAGRAVRLEERVGGAWQEIDEGSQDSAGRVSFGIGLDTVGLYTYRVVGAAAGGAAEIASGAQSVLVQDGPADTTPPGPVTGLSVTGTTTSSVTLSWTNPGDADLDGVLVRRAEGPTPPATPSSGTLVDDVLATSITDDGLDPGTQYSYALFAHDAVPNHAAPATVTTSTLAEDDTTPPGPVTGLAVTGTTTSSITLSWTNPGDADFTGAVVRRSAGPTPPSSPTAGTPVADVAKPGATVTDSGLAAGTQYSYAVFAHDAVPNHAAAATLTTTTATQPDTTPPGPVTAVSVTGATSSTLTLSWTNPPDADLAGVVVRRAQGPTPPSTPTSGTAVAVVAAPGTTVTDSGLAAGTQYSYALFARDEVPEPRAGGHGDRHDVRVRHHR